MPATNPCVPCCSTPQIVDVPGVEGVPGSDGLNGINAFTVTTGADVVVDTVGNNYSFELVSSAWMVVGQFVVFTGPATFQVVSKADTSHAVLKFLGYPSDLAVTFTITAGTQVSPAGELSVLPAPLSVDAVGTPYSLTTSIAQMVFGTTSPGMTITSPGTYLIIPHVKYNYNNATFAVQRLVTTKVRRTNNTAADVVLNYWLTAVITGVTSLAWDLVMTPTIYTTANNDDAIELQAGVATSDGTPGTVDAVVASIVAIRLF